MRLPLSEDQLLSLLRTDFAIWKWRENLDDRGITWPFAGEHDEEEPDTLGFVLDVIGVPAKWPDGRKFERGWLEERWYQVVAEKRHFPEDEARAFLRETIEALPSILAEYGFPAPSKPQPPTEDYF